MLSLSFSIKSSFWFDSSSIYFENRGKGMRIVTILYIVVCFSVYALRESGKHNLTLTASIRACSLSLNRAFSFSNAAESALLLLPLAALLLPFPP